MTFLTILIVIAAILLVLLVLVQNSKGGGLAAGLSSGNQVMGAPKTADFLEKASWTLMAIIIVLSIVSAGFNSSSSEEATDSVTSKAAEMVAEGMAPSVDPANTDVATTGEETSAQ
jgi:preprotein translocase subunit SecG